MSNMLTAQSETNGQATRTEKTFKLEYTISININAAPEKIWTLLTNAPNFPNWNSTIKSIKGNIAQGEKIKLVTTLAPDRTFSLKVKTFEPNKKMVWKDGFAPMFSGVRTYTLTPQQNGATTFTMTEALKGLMLPMIKKSLPDFRKSFRQYALDLKKESEEN